MQAQVVGMNLQAGVAQSRPAAKDAKQAAVQARLLELQKIAQIIAAMGSAPKGEKVSGLYVKMAELIYSGDRQDLGNLLQAQKFYGKAVTAWECNEHAAKKVNELGSWIIELKGRVKSPPKVAADEYKNGEKH